jgi:hypothetical protein
MSWFLAGALNLFAEGKAFVVILFVELALQYLPEHFHFNRLLAIYFNSFDD